MSKKDITKQLIVPAVTLGIGIEGLVQTHRGTDELSAAERIEQSTPTQNLLRNIWSIIKVGALALEVTDKVRAFRK